MSSLRNKMFQQFKEPVNRIKKQLVTRIFVGSTYHSVPLFRKELQADYSMKYVMPALSQFTLGAATLICQPWACVDEYGTGREQYGYMLSLVQSDKKHCRLFVPIFNNEKESRFHLVNEKYYEINEVCRRKKYYEQIFSRIFIDREPIELYLSKLRKSQFRLFNQTQDDESAFLKLYHENTDHVSEVTNKREFEPINRMIDGRRHMGNRWK